MHRKCPTHSERTQVNGKVLIVVNLIFTCSARANVFHLVKVSWRPQVFRKQNERPHGMVGVDFW